MENIYDTIEKMGIVPVVSLEDAADAEPLAQALCDGGLPCVEVTFRTSAAEESIKRITKKFPNMLVGAGTISTIKQVDCALTAGAKFIVSPGFNPTTIKYCMDKNIPILPGTSSASDIEAALSFGIQVVKFFPAEQIGGLPVIKALSAPYKTMRFMPTGGIHMDNITNYLAHDEIIACGGSWMVKNDLIKAKEFEKIKEQTEQSISKILGFELRHIGINCDGKSKTATLAHTLSHMFGFPYKERGSSVSARNVIEAVNSSSHGTHGHITIATNSILRAKYYLENRGLQCNESTIQYDGRKITAAFLQEEIGGFAIHLVLK